ncbi:hypothetical protein, partial [Enterobacter cloacae complex sp. IR5448]
EFTIGEGELMAHDVPLGCAPDEYDDLISGTCSHLPKAFLKTARIDTCRLRGSRSLLLDKRILREKYDPLSQKKHDIAVWPQSVQKQSDSERITKHSLLTA